MEVNEMKLLYIAPLSIDVSNPDGISKKIFSQIKAFSNYFNCFLIYYYNSKVYLYDFKLKKERKIANGNNRLSVIRTSKRVIDDIKPNAVYIRYSKSDYSLIQLCNHLAANKTKFVIEIPTYPYDMEGNESVKGRLVNLVDRLFRRQLKNYVPRIVTFSKDDYIFGVKTINTINGVDFDSTKPDYTEINTKEEIVLIGVSAMFRVHGYDRLIEGINSYYRDGGDRKIVLKLVGSGDKYVEYEGLIKKYNLEKHVLLLGTLLGKDLEEAYKGSSVAVNSLAIHRQGLKNESTLKTKEYSAKGLPVISSSYVDAFSLDGNNKYVFIVPPNEEPIDIKGVVNFADRIYKDSDVKKIRDEIRSDGRKTCDIMRTMMPVIDYFLEIK